MSLYRSIVISRKKKNIIVEKYLTKQRAVWQIGEKIENYEAYLHRKFDFINLDFGKVVIREVCKRPTIIYIQADIMDDLGVVFDERSRCYRKL
jgi:hypothetical protein